MATWITHLRIAEGLLKRRPDWDRVQFAIGNLGPDCNLPDEKWETFDPPDTLTHFKIAGEHPYAIHDLAFYRTHIALKDSPQDALRRVFLLGYFAHLVTDNLWDEVIYQPTKQRYPDQFAADPDFVWEVKRDWYGLDFIYLRDNPDTLFFQTFLDAEIAMQFLDFLPLSAIQYKLGYIKEFYQRTDERVQALFERSYEYLSAGEVDDFVELAVSRLERIYLSLEGRIDDSGNAASSLEIID